MVAELKFRAAIRVNNYSDRVGLTLACMLLLLGLVTHYHES